MSEWMEEDDYNSLPMVGWDEISFRSFPDEEGKMLVVMYIEDDPVLMFDEDGAEQLIAAIQEALISLGAEEE
jgi:hypothetical protein